MVFQRTLAALSRGGISYTAWLFMLFWGVFIVAEVRAAEACGMAFFNLAMLSEAPGCRGGAMTCHSILNLNLYVYDNSSLSMSWNIVHRVATETFPSIKAWRRFKGRTHKPASQSHGLILVNVRWITTLTARVRPNLTKLSLIGQYLTQK